MDTTNLNQSGIYAITSPSGKRYVGSAVHIQRRWAQHRRDLAKGKHHCAGLQRAYHKYDGGLVYSVLVLCPKGELIKEEQRYMDSSAAGTLYNSAPTAGSCLGMKCSDETKARIATALRGKGPSEETRAKLSAARRGRQFSEETRARMSAAQLGKAMKNNTSGFVGVSWNTQKRVWLSYRHLCGKSVHLGCYPSAELAHPARQNFDRILRFYDSSRTQL